MAIGSAKLTEKYESRRQLTHTNFHSDRRGNGSGTTAILGQTTYGKQILPFSTTQTLTGPTSGPSRPMLFAPCHLGTWPTRHKCVQSCLRLLFILLFLPLLFSLLLILSLRLLLPSLPSHSSHLHPFPSPAQTTLPPAQPSHPLLFKRYDLGALRCSSGSCFRSTGEEEEEGVPSPPPILPPRIPPSSSFLPSWYVPNLRGCLATPSLVPSRKSENTKRVNKCKQCKRAKKCSNKFFQGHSRSLVGRSRDATPEYGWLHGVSHTILTEG